jgi:phosphopentomutase
MFNRSIIIVMDSVGAGEAPDAKEYGDVGSDTLGNIAKAVGGLNLPNFAAMGLGNLHSIMGVPPSENPSSLFGRIQEASKGKDTTTGHWEIAGLVTNKPFPTYPDGFPPEIMKPFEEKINKKTLANKAASGTVIIEELGEEHIKTGYPIVYTSADSVFQIAAHEEIIPVPELYEICEIARSLLVGEHMVSRVIARPFAGEPGHFTRTSNRHDFSISPPEKTLLDHLKDDGYDVIGVGKIKDIFNGKGVTDSYKIKDNIDGLKIVKKLLAEPSRGLIFANLVDFDMKYGHRNDVEGYARALVEMDAHMPDILGALKDDDILFITADHGCDPTTPSTDHSREFVPLLAFSPSIKGGVNLGIRNGFCDVAKTIDDIFKLNKVRCGVSFMDSFIQK